MKRADEIKIFIFKELDFRFTVLICIDFYSEAWRLFDYEFNGRNGVDMIFVPSYNDRSEYFQKCCDAFCQSYTSDTIKVSNIEGLTCIYGRAHKNLIERMKIEKYRRNDDFTFKLCESFNHMMLIVDLYLKSVEIPTPIDSTPRIIIFKRYKYNNDKWEEFKNPYE